METSLNFLSDFPNDHLMAERMWGTQMTNTFETHMLRGFLLEQVMFKSYSQSNQQVAKLKVDLSTQNEEDIDANKSIKYVTKEWDKMKESEKVKGNKVKRL